MEERELYLLRDEDRALGPSVDGMAVTTAARPLLDPSLAAVGMDLGAVLGLK